MWLWGDPLAHSNLFSTTLKSLNHWVANVNPHSFFMAYLHACTKTKETPLFVVAPKTFASNPYFHPHNTPLQSCVGVTVGYESLGYLDVCNCGIEYPNTLGNSCIVCPSSLWTINCCATRSKWCVKKIIQKSDWVVKYALTYDVLNTIYVDVLCMR